MSMFTKLYVWIYSPTGKATKKARKPTGFQRRWPKTNDGDFCHITGGTIPYMWWLNHLKSLYLTVESLGLMATSQLLMATSNALMAKSQLLMLIHAKSIYLMAKALFFKVHCSIDLRFPFRVSRFSPKKERAQATPRDRFTTMHFFASHTPRRKARAPQNHGYIHGLQLIKVGKWNDWTSTLW